MRKKTVVSDAEVRAARAAYYREWRRKNPEKQAAIQRRYWEKKILSEREATKNE